MSKLKVSTRWHWPLFLALSTTLLASGQDNKRPQASPSQPATTGVQKTPASTGGIRVFIDPVTGAIREPEPEELKALSPAPAAAGAAPQFVNHPNGAVGVLLGDDQMVRSVAQQTADSEQPLTHPSGAEGILLGDDQMVFSVATIGPDGKLKMDCITGGKNAEEKVKAKPRKESPDVR